MSSSLCSRRVAWAAPGRRPGSPGDAAGWEGSGGGGQWGWALSFGRYRAAAAGPRRVAGVLGVVGGTLVIPDLRVAVWLGEGPLECQLVRIVGRRTPEGTCKLARDRLKLGNRVRQVRSREPPRPKALPAPTRTARRVMMGPPVGGR